MFLLLLTKIIPLYAATGMGYIAGKRLGVARESVAAIVFYLLIPLIMFSGVMKAELTLATLSLPFLTFAISALIIFLFLWVGKRFYSDATPNMLACTAGTGNIGYFGLPVAMALLDEQGVAIYIILMLGTTLAEASLGYFVAAHGTSTWQAALRKTLRLPTVYAAIAAAVLNTSGISMPEMFWDFMNHIRGAYIILGMMMVGLGMAATSRFEVDTKFITLAYAAKFLVWPALALGFAWLDNSLLHIYGSTVHQALFLLSIVPMAANSVVIATILDIHPGRVATAVVFSMALALFTVPGMIALFLG